MIDDARGEAPAIERDQERDSQVERHRTRMALCKDRDRLSQIIDGSPVPTFVIDEDPCSVILPVGTIAPTSH